MAPGRLSKRPRAFTEDAESVSGDVRLGQEGRGKRARHSVVQHSDVESDPDQESQRSEDEDMDEQQVEDEGDDVDELYSRQTQRVERQLRNNEMRENTPSESGIIEEIRCTNFMCHEQLTVTLGPLINFIIGHNGSGKSAVLAALTICLGGKANVTNRGQNLKSFIKEGRDFCVVSVKIKNQGSAAYKPDLYGDSIIVERHFNRTGTSGFKLKDVNGKIVSKTREHLEDIIDAFALQIDNPMNVLTQDMARQFLNDSTPKVKYNFFLKGTQLETLKKDYDLIMAELQEIENKSHTLKEDLETHREAARKAIAKARRAANVRTMVERENALAHQAAWARVREEETELDRINSEVDHVAQEIEERNAVADTQSEQFEHANQAYSEINQNVQDREAEKVPLKQEVDELEAQFKETKAKVIEVKSTERQLAGKIQSKEKSIENYKSRIYEHRQRQAEADDGQHAQKLQELEEAKELCKSAEESLTSHDDGVQSLSDDLRTAQGSKRAGDEKVKEKRHEVQRHQDTMKDLERGQSNWMDAYQEGSTKKLEKLLKAIENERGFRERPIGPIGRHVKLLKPEWSSILEKSSGGSLSAFVVTSKADQALLSKKMRENQSSYPIYIGQNTQINTTPHEPDPKLDTWLRVLKIDNNLVRNQLIINHSIDQVVLIQDRATAEEFMHRGGPARRNVKICFAMADGDPTKGHAISANAHTGSVNLGPITAWREKTRMQADKEPQLRAARSNLQRVQGELQTAMTEASQLQSDLNACQGRIQSHKQQKRVLTEGFQRAQDDAERLEVELSAATPDAEAIDQLEASLQQVQGEKEFEEGQFDDTVLRRDKLDHEAKAHKEALEEAQKRLDQLHVEIGKANARAEKLRFRREQALREKNDALEQVQRARENKSEWEVGRGRQMAVLEGIISEAEQISERVDVPEGATYDSMNRQLVRVQQEREQIEKELGGSQLELLEKANAAKKKHKDAQDGYNGLESVTKHLQRSLKTRDQRWHQFRKEISVRARITFTYLLSERQFRGDLKVDHHSKQLDIHVQPDITVANGAGRQTKTLSGGEKSFSTICLLLSLWDAMGSPIRCLDEFDVFMDNVNRNIAMKMMIAAARRAIGRQYILITPQAMGDVQSVGDVKIIKMHDPERNQTALNFRT